MTSVCEKFEILSKLNKDFVNRIKSVFVFDNYTGVHLYKNQGYNVFIITTDDLVYAFGENSEGSLGFGHKKLIREPRIVSALCYKGVIDFCHGFNHVIARTNNNDIYWWGNISCVQSEPVNKPQLDKYLSDKKILDISCGFKHCLALTEAREVYAWGSNRHGQLAISESQVSDDYELQTIPNKVNGFNEERVVTISCGGYHSIVLTESGRVFSWGSNGRGQLGVGNRRNSNLPLLVNNKSNILFKKISCGRFHSLLLSRNGDIYVCGCNDRGQLGISVKERNSTFTDNRNCNGINKDDSLNLMKIDSDFKFVDIATHFNYDISIALSDKGTYYVWGKCGDKIITYPKEVEFKSQLDVFANYFCITNSLINLSKNIIQNNSQIIKRKYEKEFSEISLIASGHFGIVCKAMKKNEHGIYAIKKIPISEDDKLIDIAIRETKIMNELKSDFVVECYDAWIEENHYKSNTFIKFENPNLDSSHEIYDYHKPLLLHIQLELCYKTLKEMIKQLNKDLNQKDFQPLTPIGYFISSELFREILEGVNYLHEKNIIHRDLKPENILITNGLSGRFVKIADFGLATIHEFEGQSHSKYKETRRYSAPEVLKSSRYDTQADIYSLGVIVQELFNIDINKTFYSGIDLLFRDKYKFLIELIDRMMSSTAHLRPKCLDILDEIDSWALSLTLLKIIENLQIPETKSLDECFYLYFIQTKLRETDELMYG